MREIQSSKDLGFFCSVNHASRGWSYVIQNATRLLEISARQEYTLFFIRTSKFDAEAERSFGDLRLKRS